VLGRAIPWRELEREALRELRGTVEHFVEARYRGQSHEIRIPDGADFHEAHRRLYGFTRGDPVDVVNAVVRVTAARPKPRFGRLAKARRPERIGAGGGGHLVTSREGLRPGDEVVGPAAIGEETASTWVPRGWTARVDSSGNINICR
jgi:N-methylhydantoinase A